MVQPGKGVDRFARLGPKSPAQREAGWVSHGGNAGGVLAVTKGVPATKSGEVNTRSTTGVLSRHECGGELPSGSDALTTTSGTAIGTAATQKPQSRAALAARDGPARAAR